MDNQQTAKSLVKTIFGFDGFWPNQEIIINAISAGRDVAAVMPTGGGKSLCYQLPSRLLPGMAVVVSPLISLMKNQVDAAKEKGFRAAYVNSSLKLEERSAVFRDARRGALELLYLAPELLNADWTTQFLASVPLSLLAIDEAHCISEWGHDFRPEYLKLGSLRKLFPTAPIAAFTATATAKAQSDIVQKLGLKDPLLVRASFDRPNLFYEVKPKKDVDKQLLEFVKRRPGASGIIYRTTRDAVENTALFLKCNGISALPYHAGMEQADRARNQDLFLEGEVDVVVATIAFGMGIDKPDVRFVAHADLPKNMEGYYQETGRAGRDGKPSVCALFYSGSDAYKVKHLLKSIEDETFRRISHEKLESVMAFASRRACRRKLILEYFNETYAEQNCGMCDVCTTEYEKTDATSDARLLLSAIQRTEQRYGPKYIANILTGSTDEPRIFDRGHDAIPEYAAGADKAIKHWTWLANALADDGLLERQGEYGVLAVTAAGEKLLDSGSTSYSAPTVVAAVKSSPVKTAAASKASIDNIQNSALLERLKKIRKDIAAVKKLPAYYIFNDQSLLDMCDKLPDSKEELLNIYGVGEKKFTSYGQAFLDEIQKYKNETAKETHAERTPPAPPEAPAAVKQKQNTAEPDMAQTMPERDSSVKHTSTDDSPSPCNNAETIPQQTAPIARTSKSHPVAALNKQSANATQPQPAAVTKQQSTAAPQQQTSEIEQKQTAAAAQQQTAAAAQQQTADVAQQQTANGTGQPPALPQKKTAAPRPPTIAAPPDAVPEVQFPDPPVSFSDYWTEEKTKELKRLMPFLSVVQLALVFNRPRNEITTLLATMPSKTKKRASPKK